MYLLRGWERSHRLEPLILLSHGSFLYVGCYTNNSPVGIRVFRAASTGPEAVGELGGVENPSFMAAHPGRTTLYAVSEAVDGNGSGGRVVSMAVDPTDGSLAVQQEVESGGDAPCHLSIDRGAEMLCVANYVSGSVTAYRLHPDGRIGDVAFTDQPAGTGGSGRQEGPHAHSAVPHPFRPGFVVADLGHDRITHYARDGAVEQRLNLEPGSGPRHVAWHPTLPVCFVVGELDNTVGVVACDGETGQFTSTGLVSTLPEGSADSSLAAEVVVSADGSKVYVSNRGHDSIAVFDFANGMLRPAAHVPSGGNGPRHFAVDPANRSMVVANQGSNSLNRFLIDPKTGVPIPTGESYHVSEPVCALFLEVSS